ncbi:uncharacterized protein LOC128396727 isoform X1 [Panonychus citri]|nr:uncharacterized protein LOC128389319 isoform X1 [Panonychus citri]XP_053213311.1 uncharacterized protein LOC128396727 isoform X1 [Panonychus citri]
MYHLPNQLPPHLPPLPPPNHPHHLNQHHHHQKQQRQQQQQQHHPHHQQHIYDNDGSVPVFYRYQYDSDYNSIINSKNMVTSSTSSDGIKKDSGLIQILSSSSHDNNNSSPLSSSTPSPSPPLGMLMGPGDDCLTGGNSAPGQSILTPKENTLSFIYPLVSFIFSTLNVIINTLLVYLFYLENQHTWFILTSTFLFIPLLLVNIFSIKWYIQDYRQYKNEPCRPRLTSFQWIIKIFAHLLLIGHIFR